MDDGSTKGRFMWEFGTVALPIITEPLNYFFKFEVLTFFYIFEFKHSAPSTPFSILCWMVK